MSIPKLRFVDFMTGRILYAQVVNHPDYKQPITIRISEINFIEDKTLFTDNGDYDLTLLTKDEILFISERLQNTIKEVTN